MGVVVRGLRPSRRTGARRRAHSASHSRSPCTISPEDYVERGSHRERLPIEEMFLVMGRGGSVEADWCERLLRLVSANP